MIKSILGGKSKNLFDISKVVTSNYVKRSGNSLICSTYGTSIGTLGSICPTLKPSDLITISFKCASEGVPSNFMAFGGRTFYSGATFLVSEIGLSTPWYLYSTDYAHKDIPNKTTYSDIQLELGSTATEYVPHELTSYKSIMKVSDVCQLLNKSKYPATVTRNGVTVTNNGDGTVTLNGTNTDAGANLYTFMIVSVKAGHYYYIYSGQTGTWGTCMFTVDKSLSAASADGNIGFQDGSYDDCAAYLFIGEGASFNNFTVKPQFFDLTEMFGAGNEPKTVAEFKAKFPNDYYPYSPSCFVTSFDERMPCKTKNLFDPQINLWEAKISALNYDNGIYYTKDYASRIIDLTNVDTDYQLSFQIKHRDRGTEYPYSASWALSKDGKTIYYGKGSDSETFVKLSYTLTLGSTYTLLIYNSIYLGYVQLEKGTTATDYVPYGYV